MTNGIESWADVGSLSVLTESQLSDVFDYYTEMIDSFDQFFSYYSHQVQYVEKIKADYFEKIDFEHVIYDEIETFRNHDHHLFKYPYGPRKTKLLSFVLDP